MMAIQLEKLAGYKVSESEHGKAHIADMMPIHS